MNREDIQRGSEKKIHVCEVWGGKSTGMKYLYKRCVVFIHCYFMRSKKNGEQIYVDWKGSLRKLLLIVRESVFIATHNKKKKHEVCNINWEERFFWHLQGNVRI